MAIELNNKEANYVINKMIHDLRSPLFCLEFITKFSNETPDEQKNQLIRCIARINGILNSCSNDSIEITESSDSYIWDLADIVKNAISEKELEYSNYNLDISFDRTNHLNPLKAMGNTSDIERALSNILNNAIESAIDKSIKIKINVEIDNNYFHIIIEDNGKGMPQHVLNKINSAESITHGKANGHGFGMQQIREAMEKCSGKFAIYSAEDIGTKIILSFRACG